MDDLETSDRIEAAFRHIVMTRPLARSAATPARAGRRRAWLVLPAAFAAVVIAAVVVSTVVAPPAAEASWTSVPTSPDPMAATIAAQTCGPRAGALPLRLMDHRVRTTVALYADNGNDLTCQFTVDASGKVVDSFSGEGRFDPHPVASGLDILTADLGSGAGPVMIVGRAPSDATTVKVGLADGTNVTASVGGGYYLAWWPKSTGIDSVTALGASGKTLAGLNRAAVDSLVPGNP